MLFELNKKALERREFILKQLVAGFAFALNGWTGFGHMDKQLENVELANKRKNKMRLPKKIVTAKPHIEGAGVHLHRGFGFGETTPYDPFLLFDDFRNDAPRMSMNGFPWHPHGGIETITYVLTGEVEHRDSLGNTGSLGAGDIQWMLLAA